jgi:CelD/BcsL family acetyltransferase involved in cellulose biosynthesis
MTPQMIQSLKRQSEHRLVIESPNDLLRQHELIDAWNSLRTANSSLRSPYFSPCFAESIVAAGLEIEVAVQRDHGEIVAIWPFQRKTQTIAAPIGGGLNDAHGMIIGDKVIPDWSSMLNESLVTRYDFHAALANQVGGFALGTTPAFAAHLNLSAESYEDYLSKRSYTIRRQAQKSRKLARSLGPLRLEIDCRDPKLLALVLDWKSRHYRRTNILDIFSIPWVKRLVFNLHASPQPFRGQLSVLFAGSTPVAGHFGIRDGDLLHYWYPTYDQRHRSTSPGTQLFLEIANTAPEHGLNVIDFGYGDRPYKQVLSNVRSEVQSGTVTFNPFSKMSYLATSTANRLVKRTWFKEQAKALVRRIAPQLGRRQFSATVSDSRDEPT